MVDLMGSFTIFNGKAVVDVMVAIVVEASVGVGAIVNDVNVDDWFEFVIGLEVPKLKAPWHPKVNPRKGTQNSPDELISGYGDDLLLCTLTLAC